MEIKKTEALTLLDAGAAFNADARFILDESHPFTVVPDGYKIADLERFKAYPVRKRGRVNTTDVRSFVDYMTRHGSEPVSTIYAQLDTEQNKLRMVGVLNDHNKDGTAGWMDHSATFEPEKAVEWKRWIEKDRAPMNQSDFATWLEDNLGDIAGVEGMPSGSQMLTMALQFEANSDKRLRSKVNLQSGGVRFEFVDDETKETRTSMDVFQRFTLGLPVFYGSTSKYPVEARLKYREKDGKVSFWYELIRADLVFKTAADEETNRIAAATGFLIINGTV